MATAFHNRYLGNPIIEYRDRDNNLRQFVGRVMAHCTCALGRWMRAHCSPDVQARMFDADDILRGHKPNWSLTDPTEAPVDMDEVPDWREFRRQLNSKPILKSIPQPAMPTKKFNAVEELRRESGRNDDEPPF
jgi:hypothetical protein